MAQLTGRPLTETRVRAVLSFLSHGGGPDAAPKHDALVRDYLRMMEIRGALASLSEVVGQLPDDAGVDIARIAALRAQVSCGAQPQRPVFAPEEEAAVRACFAEIDATLRRLQG